MDNVNYNEEPVFFCKHCLSLAIVSAGGIDYCCKCNSVDIGVASIEDYDEIHQLKFGKKLFNK